MRRYLSAMLVAGLFALGSVAHAAPSFDCNRASTKNEIAICGDSQLADTDSQMADLFAEVKAKLPAGSEAADKAQAEQREWLKSIEFCNGEKGCLLGEYQPRINRLGFYLRQLSPAATAAQQRSVGELIAAQASAAQPPAQAMSVPSTAPVAAAPAAAPSPEASAAQPIAAQSKPGEDVPSESLDSDQPRVGDSIFAHLGHYISGTVFIIVMFGIFGIPTIIAHRRGHAYKWVIFGISFLMPIGWLIGLIWAMFPSDKSILDPILGNLTGLGKRNVGDTAGAVAVGYDRGAQEESDSGTGLDHKKIDRLTELAALRDKGVISDAEFETAKAAILPPA